MDRSSGQKINKETLALNDTLDVTDLIDIYRAFHPKTAEYTSFSSAQETFSRIDSNFGHTSNLSIFKKTEIISSIFSKHNTKQLEKEQINCQVSKRKEIIKIRQKTNEIETKKTAKKSMKLKVGSLRR